MEKIYSLEEPGLPRFRVEVSDVRPILFFETVMQGSPGRAGEHTCRALDRGEVQRLHSALGEWLYPQNLGPTTAEREEAVKALHTLAAGLANAIRPLWSAERCRRCGVARGAARTGCAGDARECEYIRPGDRGYEFLAEPAPACRCHDNEGNSVLPDPEPRDVGHPEPEPLCTRTRPADAHPVSRCTFCGHLWSDHADPTPLERVRSFYRSTLSPEAVVPVSECTCTHRDWSHSITGCLIEDCDCAAPATGAPALRQAVVPECGLCKQPWNDTHGQPENPCAGAPKQLVGCECGHGWKAHSRSERIGCFATLDSRDATVCECTRTRPGGSRGTCTCAHPRQVHGPHGCDALGVECACRRTP